MHESTIDGPGNTSTLPVPVLVLGGSITGLGAARSLGPLGIPVFATCARKDMAAWSRWVRVLNGGIPEFSTVPQLEEYLGSVQFERMVLLPCSDNWSEVVASLPPTICGRFPSFLSSLDVLRRLTDKERFATLVRENNIPCPQTHFVHEVADLDRLELAPGTQFFLKARNSQRFIARTGVKAYMVSSRDEIQRRVSELSAAGLGVVLQEYVPGPATNHFFVDGFADRDSSVRALFVRQRLRMSPPHFGNSTYMRSVSLAKAADLSVTVERLISVSGLRGIFSVELKRDDRTGIAKVLEVNARPWWYVNFATTCGVNVCEMAYREALSLPPAVFNHSYRVGRTCVYFLNDYRACRELWRAGKLSWMDGVRAWFGGEHTIASLSDPLPALNHAIELARLWIRRVTTLLFAGSVKSRASADR